MTPTNIHHIAKHQLEYKELIAQFMNRYDINLLTWKQIASFIDEVKYFWLARLDIIEIELGALSEQNSCFLLSGAIYLNVSENEHFYFKSIGDYHLLDDPFLRLDRFFRIPEASISTDEIKDYFQRTLFDSIKILESYWGAFFILPIRLLIEDDEKYHELLDKFFLNVISSLFGRQYEDQDSFCREYETFEDIEKHLEPHVLECLIFSNYEDASMSLRMKIEMYNKSQSSYTKLMTGKSEAEVFLVTLYSYISQISDILLTCVTMGLYPYIRYEIAFHYLLVIMPAFVEDEMLRDIIEKAIVFYIFRKALDGVFEYHDSFEDYWERIAEKNTLPKIINCMREQKIDIFQQGAQEVVKILENLFEDEISHNKKLAADAK